MWQVLTFKRLIVHVLKVYFYPGGYDGHDTTDSVEYLDLGIPNAGWEDGEARVAEMDLAKSALASVALPYRLVEEILMNLDSDSEDFTTSMDTSNTSLSISS